MKFKVIKTTTAVWEIEADNAHDAKEKSNTEKPSRSEENMKALPISQSVNPSGSAGRVARTAPARAPSSPG